MKKIILTIFILLFSTSLLAFGNPSGFQNISSTALQNGISSYTTEASSKGKSKISYSEMINFLKKSEDPKKIMVLGILYSQDSVTPDDYGEIIHHNIELSKKYLLNAYQLGEVRALTILAGLILYNDNMAKLDPKLELTEKYLEESYSKGDNEAGLLLATTKILKMKYQEGIKLLLSIKNDPEADLSLAIIFKKGIYSEKLNKMVVLPNDKLANYYLNKACTAENKSDYVNNFCSSKSVETYTK